MGTCGLPTFCMWEIHWGHLLGLKDREQVTAL